MSGTTDPIKQAMNEALGTTREVNSVHNYLERTIGEVISKTITIDANNTSANVNCFQLVGSVEIKRIYGVIATKTTLTNCTGAYFNLYDSTDTFPITKNDGVLSGMAVGTFFLKNATLNTTMAVANNATGRITESTLDKKAFSPFIVTQKTGANTYVRFSYTTTDTPADATFTIYAEYREPPSGGGSLTVV